MDILRFNDLSSVTEITPGTELRIPRQLVIKANRELEKSLQTIHRATQEGARLFAADLIAKAIAVRDKALEKRQAGDWETCLALARDANATAAEALRVTLARREADAEAVLGDRKGSVQGRKSKELVWSDRALNAILIEEEKIRTLSQSLAQIVFRDESRVRLHENSQAVILKMRLDRLTKEQQASVSLVEGDIYALLRGRSKRRKFNLEVPGIKTDIGSTNFWVSRDTKFSKFANYDERQIRVTSVGKSVTLGKNQGAVVPHKREPSASISLLSSPKPTVPQDEQKILRNNVELSWSTVKDAVSYWLEVAQAPSFQNCLKVEDSCCKALLPAWIMPSMSLGPFQLGEMVGNTTSAPSRIPASSVSLWLHVTSFICCVQQNLPRGSIIRAIITAYCLGIAGCFSLCS